METPCAKCVFALCIRDLVMVLPESNINRSSAQEEDKESVCLDWAVETLQTP